jgi:flagellar FliJ protein
MPAARQLQFLEKLEAEKAEVQAVLLAKARQAVVAAETQLDQLKRYENGYNDQLLVKLENAITIDALRGHHKFMGNIAQAIRAQELEVARRRANADAVHRIWQQIEQRRQAFRLMGEKAEREERRADDRREQKNSDEFASRRLLQSHLGRM